VLRSGDEGSFHPLLLGSSSPPIKPTTTFLSEMSADTEPRRRRAEVAHIDEQMLCGTLGSGESSHKIIWAG